MADLATIEATISQLAEDVRALKAQDRPKPQGSQRIVKMDAEKRLVYAEVYVPDVPDAHGHEMTAVEIEKMAHNFLANARTMMIDLNHDNDTGYGCAMVESFIARAGDPDYVPGAWVACVFVGNDKIWKAIKDGDITGFSFEGRGYVSEVPDPLGALTP